MSPTSRRRLVAGCTQPRPASQLTDVFDLGRLVGQRETTASAAALLVALGERLGRLDECTVEDLRRIVDFLGELPDEVS